MLSLNDKTQHMAGFRSIRSLVCTNQVKALTNQTCPSDPDGSRTRVTAVKGRCPRPLDDGAICCVTARREVYLTTIDCQYERLFCLDSKFSVRITSKLESKHEKMQRITMQDSQEIHTKRPRKRIKMSAERMRQIERKLINEPTAR